MCDLYSFILVLGHSFIISGFFFFCFVYQIMRERKKLKKNYCRTPTQQSGFSKVINDNKFTLWYFLFFQHFNFITKEMELELDIQIYKWVLKSLIFLNICLHVRTPSQNIKVNICCLNASKQMAATLQCQLVLKIISNFSFNLQHSLFYFF